jgi:hypothetical protein
LSPIRLEEGLKRYRLGIHDLKEIPILNEYDTFYVAPQPLMEIAKKNYRVTEEYDIHRPTLGKLQKVNFSGQVKYRFREGWYNYSELTNSEDPLPRFYYHCINKMGSFDLNWFFTPKHYVDNSWVDYQHDHAFSFLRCVNGFGVNGDYIKVFNINIKFL